VKQLKVIILLLMVALSLNQVLAQPPNMIYQEPVPVVENTAQPSVSVGEQPLTPAQEAGSPTLAPAAGLVLSGQQPVRAESYTGFMRIVGMKVEDFGKITISYNPTGQGMSHSATRAITPRQIDFKMDLNLPINQKLFDMIFYAYSNNIGINIGYDSQGTIRSVNMGEANA
jgi:hypothetical protein